MHSVMQVYLIYDVYCLPGTTPGRSHLQRPVLNSLKWLLRNSKAFRRSPLPSSWRVLGTFPLLNIEVASNTSLVAFLCHLTTLIKPH